MTLREETRSLLDLIDREVPDARLREALRTKVKRMYAAAMEPELESRDTLPAPKAERAA